MKRAELPENEFDRLADLREYKIMDTPPEAEFDDLVQLAARIANVPISLITLLDEKRQWFKSSVGISFSETARDLSFCSHTILGNSLMVVSDAAKDERFRGNPFVTGEPGIRFYAGVPLMSHRGNPIGTLCVLDHLPNELKEEQQFALKVLSRQVVKQLELKRINNKLEDSNRIQSLLMSILLRDIKSPLAATGTFLNLLQKDVDMRLDIAKYAGMAAKQYHRSLSLLDSVIEWGRIYNSREDRPSTELEPAKFIAGLISDLKEISRSKGYVVMNQASGVSLKVSNGRELYFILRNAVLWLFDCAEGGEIVIEDIRRHEKRLSIRIKLTSESLLKTVNRSIQHINSGCLWSDNPDLALDGLPVRLAKDIAIARKGSLFATYNGRDAIEVEIFAEI